MLKQEAIDDVMELLRRGDRSQRAIARLTGVSRGVVNDLATGKRSPHGWASTAKAPGEGSRRFDWRPCRRCGGVRLPDRCVRCDAEAFSRKVRPAR